MQAERNRKDKKSAGTHNLHYSNPGHRVKYFWLFPMAACFVPPIGQPTTSAAQLQPGFLPATGQTFHYLFIDTITTPSGATMSAANLTLKAIDGNQLRIEVAVDGGESQKQVGTSRVSTRKHVG